MLLGCLGLLIAAGFLTEVPPLLEATIAPTNETTGAFVQTKRDHGRVYVSRGTYRIRPGVGFEWKTSEPFETTFIATESEYTYSNEDETVTKAISEIRGGELFEAISKRDLSNLFTTFDTLYKEEDGKFFLKAKPKVRSLKRALAQVEAEGCVTNWMMKATFPNGVTFEIELKDD